jgi:hypothetical protein
LWIAKKRQHSATRENTRTAAMFDRPMRRVALRKVKNAKQDAGQLQKKQISVLAY